MFNIGSANEFCKDDITKIENYEQALNDKERTWDIHHRLELTLDGEFAHTPKELERLGMYRNRPYFELIFLTRSEHKKLHNNTKKHKEKASKSMKKVKHTNEWNKNVSKALKGKSKTKEHIENISKALKGKRLKVHSEFGKKFEEHYGLHCSENMTLYSREQHWYYNHNHKCRWE